MLVNPDTSHHKKEVRTRQRASTSCTECRRRKQKCNQAKDRPCNNCARRYPPVPCVYEGLKKLYKSKGKVSEPAVQPKIEPPEAESSEILATIQESDNYASDNYLDRKPVLQLITNDSKPSRPISHGGSIGLLPYEDDESPTSPVGSNDISPNIRALQYYPYREHFKKSYYGVTKMHVGSVALSPLHFLPFDPSIRNAQLLHFFLQRLAPFMSSIDGNDPPPAFNDKWLPFMIQSPIAGYIAILTSSYFQATARQIEWTKSVDVMGARVKLITLINTYLTSQQTALNDEAISTVMSLAYNELVYADERSSLAHMRGLQEMIKSRGGLQSIEFSTLREMLIRTDYQVAFTFECDLFLDKTLDKPIPTLESYPVEMDSPLIKSNIRFVDSAEALNISTEAARVLDDMRFLTTSVLHLNENEGPEMEVAKLMTTVHWIHHRLVSSNEPEFADDFMYQTCRTAGIIYSTAILTRTPLSRACTAQLLQQLWMTMWRVPLSRWKKVPGIFLWVILVVNSYARDKPEARFLKGLMPSAVVTLGLLDWDATMATLDGFLTVQKWLAGMSRVFIVPSRHSPKPASPKGGLPEWAIKE